MQQVCTTVNLYRWRYQYAVGALESKLYRWTGGWAKSKKISLEGVHDSLTQWWKQVRQHSPWCAYPEVLSDVWVSWTLTKVHGEVLYVLGGNEGGWQGTYAFEPWSDMENITGPVQNHEQSFLGANIQGRNTTKRLDKWALLKAHATKHQVQVCAVQEA